MTSTFLSAEWRDILMLNYEADPAALRGLVPADTELDAWEGRTFVSVVGFRFLNTRVLGVPVPFHRHFEEVNLRFYVRRRTDHDVRRGVVFIKEIVPRRAVAWVARAVYGERYVALPMRHEIDAGRTVAYAWRHGGRWNGMAAAIAGNAAIPPDGSQEAFITEHYWGYTARREGRTLEYQVEHPRWPVYRAADAAFDCDVAAIYGPSYAEIFQQPPASAFVADGSAVTVHRGVRIA